MTAHVLPGLVKFAFTSDVPTLRMRLFDAILSGQCPDFECSLGSPSGTGSSYTALWRPEHADAVRAWARSSGIRLFNMGCASAPMAHIQVPDISDMVPGGVIGPCISDAERMLADQGLEPTAGNWLAVCDHFLSLSLICGERAAAFRLLRRGIERAALAAVKINPRPALREISQGAVE